MYATLQNAKILHIILTIVRTFLRIAGEACELWQQCECHSGVRVSQESHSSEGFNIAEVVLTP